ncbi:MAG: FAD-dependent oxidoreductase [Phycisphaerales bacterium]|nr:FAD-dependent oxidoreductase [Phycisphaerales bacterium]
MTQASHFTTQFQAPDLSDDRIIKIVSGLRPCRHGGLRLESETLGTKTIIHNYGHGGSGITLSLGTAIAASDLVDNHTDSKSPIAVLGAGVIGLTTARELAMRGHQVTIYAKDLSHDTVSVIAGALWLPVGIDIDHPEIGSQKLNNLLKLAHDALSTLDPSRYGIEPITVFEPAYAQTNDHYFDNGTIPVPTPVDRLPFPGPPRSGRSFDSLFIHTPRYLDALVEDLAGLGVQIINREFTDAHQLESLQEPILINCLALGSLELFNDEAMYPARGILVHMEPQDLGYAVHDGFKFIFPRDTALILGGCFDEDVWDETPDEKIAAEIIAHHRRFFGLS